MTNTRTLWILYCYNYFSRVVVNAFVQYLFVLVLYCWLHWQFCSCFFFVKLIFVSPKSEMFWNQSSVCKYAAPFNNSMCSKDSSLWCDYRMACYMVHQAVHSLTTTTIVAQLRMPKIATLERWSIYLQCIMDIQSKVLSFDSISLIIYIIEKSLL